MTNDTSLESSCAALLLKSATKISKFAKIDFFYCKIQLYSKNVCKKKICPKNKKIIHFWKALDHAISNMQNFLHSLNNIIFNQEKLKICKFPLTG